MLFITDTAKIFLAQRLGVMVNSRNMSRVHRVAGFALIFSVSGRFISFLTGPDGRLTIDHTGYWTIFEQSSSYHQS